MVQGMSSDAWDEFSKTILERCLIICLWNPLLGSLCVIKKDLCIPCGGSFQAFNLPEYVFSFTFFHCRSFSTCIGGRQHLSFCHRRYKIFMLFSSNKKCLLCFFCLFVCFFFYLSLQISFALFLFEFRWPVAYFLFFLRLSLALYSKFVDITINLSLILQKTRIQKQFPLSVFVFIDSLASSALQDEGGYAIFRQNKLELHLGCHT